MGARARERARSVATINQHFYKLVAPKTRLNDAIGTSQNSAFAAFCGPGERNTHEYFWIPKKKGLTNDENKRLMRKTGFIHI